MKAETFTQLSESTRPPYPAEKILIHASNLVLLKGEVSSKAPETLLHPIPATIMSLSGLDRIQDCHVVAIPFPGRSHINPMMNVCTLLASKGLTITVVVTEEFLTIIKPGSGSVPTSPNVQFRSIPNVLPSEQSPGRDFAEFIVAVSTKMEAPVDHLLDQLHPPPTCIIADTFLAWPVSLGNRRNIPVTSVFLLLPAMFSLHYHYHLLVAHGHHAVDNISERKDEIITYIPGIPSIRLGDLPFIYLPNHEIIKKILQDFNWVTKAQFILFTSFYELQPHIFDTLRGLLPMPIYPVGPSIPFMSLQDSVITPSDQTSNGNAVDYFKWLDCQPKNSVLYVSFGSFLSPSASQMHEFAMGLRSSGVRYLWVARDQVLNFQETCGEMGLIIPWCDQLRVLCHSSVAGFMTHCGWNSTLEAIYAGLPMLTFPLLGDQYPTSSFIVDDLKIGLRVKEEIGLENDVGRDKIAQVVRRLMDGGGGVKMRERAKELQRSCRRAIEKDGSTYKNLNAFIEDIVSINNGEFANKRA